MKPTLSFRLFSSKQSPAYQFDSATARSVLRNAIHNITCTMVNSNATQRMAPGASHTISMFPWRIGLIAADVAIGLLLESGVV